MAIALGELAVRFGCELRGDPALTVDHVAPLTSAGAGAITFLANSKLAASLATARASAVILDARSAAACPVAALISSNPHALFARVAALLYPLPPLKPGVHPSAVVDASAQLDASAEVGAHVTVGADVHIGARVYIGPGCVIAAGTHIGADSRLVTRVSLEHAVHIGERVLIHAGAVIGADGFGYARESTGWLKVPQVGGVRIADDVEIGANTTIDRGAIDDTVIGPGVKLDNLIQIAHNVQIGAHTAIAACTGVSGSTRIGARCMIGGACGLAGHIEICDDVVITGKSSVTKSIRVPGMYSSTIPIEPIKRWWRIVARFKRLAPPEIPDARASHDEMPQDTHDD